MKNNNTPVAMNVSERMRKLLKVALSIIAVIVAMVILSYILKALGSFMIHVSEIADVPL